MGRKGSGDSDSCQPNLDVSLLCPVPFLQQPDALGGTQGNRGTVKLQDWYKNIQAELEFVFPDSLGARGFVPVDPVESQGRVSTFYFLQAKVRAEHEQISKYAQETLARGKSLRQQLGFHSGKQVNARGPGTYSVFTLTLDFPRSQERFSMTIHFSRRK